MDKFLEFISNEEKVFLENQSKLQNEYALFVILDDIYQKPIQNIDSILDKDKNLIQHNLAILLLYNLAHLNLYLSISCFLRAHFSEALFHCRKGIDTGLSAYKIILEPNLASAYLNAESQEYKKIFKRIKQHFKEEMNNNSNKYSLANGLIDVYEKCNPYSHADIRTLDLILGQISTFGNFYNFQLSENDEKYKQYKQYFVVVIAGFLKIFHIFKLFFDEKFKVKDTSLENSIENLSLKLDKELRNIQSLPLKKDAG